jgi:signal transduction histidine kinase
MMSALTFCLVVALAACAGLLLRLRALQMALAERCASAETGHIERDAQVREQAASQERERIYSDLHDDLGAKLLSLVYRAESPVQADLARAILQDLRDVVTRSRGTPGTLGDVLADIRSEATQRLAAVGIGLAWDEADHLPDPMLDSGHALHLHRIVREAISNTIRHAQARHLRVRVRAAAGELLLELTDDGSGVPAVLSAGSGMRNMRTRAGELDGRIDWVPGTEGGAKVLLRMPLDANA